MDDVSCNIILVPWRILEASWCQRAQHRTGPLLDSVSKLS